jgi:hypothetical protein
MRLQHATDAAKAITFEQCVARFVDAHKAGWKNEKHVAQWQSTLAEYCHSVFGSTSVADGDTGLVLKAIEPIWTEKHLH